MFVYLTIGLMWMFTINSFLQYGGSDGFTKKQVLFNIILWPLGVIFTIRAFMDDGD